tara:strand:+ start:641 stop:1093 length:453 start_codon:yes stop_codon:yes gene_type:complete
MPIWSKVYPHDLGESDVVKFHNAIGTDPHSGGIDGVVRDIYDGEMELWLGESGDNSAILVTEVLVRKDQSCEMFITMCAGDGLFLNQTEGMNELRKHASDRGCSEINAIVDINIAVGNFNLVDGVKNKDDRLSDGLHEFDVTSVSISMRV